jgi:hypothetical protein
VTFELPDFMLGVLAAVVLDQHAGRSARMVGKLEGARPLQFEHTVELVLQKADARRTISDLELNDALCDRRFEFRNTGGPLNSALPSRVSAEPARSPYLLEQTPSHALLQSKISSGCVKHQPTKLSSDASGKAATWLHLTVEQQS